MRARIVAIGAVIVMAAAACGNSEDTTKSPVTAAPGGASVTTVSDADLQKNVPVDAPGVTDDSIGAAVITATTNILGGHYGEMADGVQAYFDYQNSLGGIYGRQLKILKHRDDQMLQNEKAVKESLAQDDAFATFYAGPLFTGLTAIEQSNPSMPTFIWNINPEIAGVNNVFGSLGQLCSGCLSQEGPFFAQQQGFKKIGVLGYNSTAASKECATGIRDSFERYPSATVEVFDNNIAFGQADLSAQVKAMKDKGVEHIQICMDSSEALILAKEMQRQGLEAGIMLPNAYDQEYISENAELLEGSFVQPQFVPFETDELLDEQKLLQEWVAKSGKTMREVTVEGWIMANMFVHALKLAGPEFSQQKVIDALNQETNFTANGMKEPIDWTKQHEDPKENPDKRSKTACTAILKVEGGKLVPLPTEPGKPWTCLPGGFTPEQLDTKAEYRSFAPTG